MDNKKLLLIGGAVLLLAIAITNPLNVDEKIVKGIKKVANTISEYGINFLKNIESLSLHVYPDAGGYSIGYGHYLGKTATLQQITEAQADAFLRQDIQKAENAIKSMVKVPLTQNQHDALVSFIYNIGVGGFSQSTTLKKLNAGDYQGSADAMLMWNKSQGKVNNALVARRNSERQLFLA